MSMVKLLETKYSTIEQRHRKGILLELLGHQRMRVYTSLMQWQDSSGNKSLSNTSTVTVTLGDNLVPNVNLTALNSEYEASQSIFLSAQISDEANSSTGLV